MSQYGCGKSIKVDVPTKYSSKSIDTTCGSTSYYGGVNQCEECEERTPLIELPYEDEGDLEYDHRINGMGDEE